MLLDVSRALRAPGEEFAFTAQTELPDQEFMGDTVVFPEPVRLTGFYTSAEGGVLVRGRLSVTAQAPCARCLKPATVTLQIPVQEVFTRLTEGQTPDDAEAYADSLYYTGNQVDLSGIVLTLTLLELPMRFLCEPECPEIGSDASVPEPQSACPPEQTHRPFAGLDKLLKKDEEV